MVLAEDVQFALRGQGADGREMLVGVPLPQDRGVAYGGIRPDHAGQGIKARFVYEEDRVLLRLRPFLIAGQVSSRQRAIAASLRCRARRIGFCGLQ
jgi:hypothetical protein